MSSNSDLKEPGSNGRSDHYGKLGFGSTDRSNGRGNIIPAAVSKDRFHASTPSSSESAQGHEGRFASPKLSGGCGFRKETIPETRRYGPNAPNPAVRANTI